MFYTTRELARIIYPGVADVDIPRKVKHIHRRAKARGYTGRLLVVRENGARSYSIWPEDAIEALGTRKHGRPKNEAGEVPKAEAGELDPAEVRRVRADGDTVLEPADVPELREKEGRK